MKTAILLIQLGTPDAPTASALRPYLRQFLGDPRVIYFPSVTTRIVWWLVKNLIVLPFRPAASAAKYARVWDKDIGSPLMHYTQRQVEELRKRFPGVPIEFGMQVGNPSVASVIDKLLARRIERIIVLPMYPQYSATTTASATDALFAALQKVNRVPALRIVPPYFEHPAYIGATASIIREQLAKLDWEPEHFVISFHGIPIRYAQDGDPYALHCKRTTFRLVEAMGWKRSQWTQTFQSLFGREEWLKPYTEDTLIKMAKKGMKRVFVITPGFTADCLETIDEIGHEALEVFEEHGGEKLFQCPCLNDHPAWIAAMDRLIREEGIGWLADTKTPTESSLSAPVTLGTAT
ncbi:MAG: ferrochelatase [Planctomycetia bacterium]|nr:ferrochelatase [Planctomycetia bacterium]